MRYILIFFLMIGTAYGHYFHDYCEESVSCLKSIGRCVPVKDRTYQFIYMVKYDCINDHHGEEGVTKTVVEESDLFSIKSSCQNVRASVKEVFPACN